MRSYKAARRAAQREQAALEPIPFEVTYEDEIPACDPASCKKPGCRHRDTVFEERTETFQARGELSAATGADLGYFAEVALDSPEGAAVARRIFMEVIGDRAEFARFWRIAPLIDEDTLSDIMVGLIEDTAGRPTPPSAGSPSSSSTTGQGSRDGSPAPGSIHVAS